MKDEQDPQNTPGVQSLTHVSLESQSDQHNNKTGATVADSGSVSISSNINRKVSRADIEFVQHLIERCLQLYMNRDEAVKTLLNRARIDHGFTTLVWQKLEEENSDFFRAYYVRLKLKKQIILFNHLLERQYHLTRPKVSSTPMENAIHPMPVNNLPMGYFVQQQLSVPVTGQPHLDTMGSGISSCHVVNGFPAPGNFQPIHMNSGNDMVMDSNVADVAPAIPPSNAMSPMSRIPVSQIPVAPAGDYPFTSSEMGVDTSVLGIAFPSDAASSVELQLSADGGAGASRNSYGSLDQIPWDFSLSDLTTDLSNIGDLGDLENYPGSPYLLSDSDIFPDSPQQDDIEEFFVDSVPGSPCSQSDEEKS